MRVVLIFLSVFLFPLLTVSAKDSPAQMRYKIGKYLYPNGFPDSAIGSLDKRAAGEGMIVYKNGKQFDRLEVQREIALKASQMKDVDLLMLRKTASLNQEK